MGKSPCFHSLVVLINTVLFVGFRRRWTNRGRLSSETIKSAALSFQGVHDVEGSDCLSACVLSVGDSVTDHVLKEHFEDASGLLVNETRDTLDTTSACQTTDGRLRYALDVISKDLSVSLGSTLAETLSSFSATRHD